MNARRIGSEKSTGVKPAGGKRRARNVHRASDAEISARMRRQLKRIDEIDRRRRVLGISRLQLCAAAEVALSTYDAIRAGKNLATPATLARLGNALRTIARWK